MKSEEEEDTPEPEIQEESETNRRKSTRNRIPSLKLTSLDDLPSFNFVLNPSRNGQKSSTSQSNAKTTPLGKAGQNSGGDRAAGGDEIPLPSMRKKICKKLFQALIDIYGMERTTSQSLTLFIEKNIRQIYSDMGPGYRHLVKNLFGAIKVLTCIPTVCDTVFVV